MDITGKLTEELKVERWQVEAAVKLIDEGNTIPFISRYRKEVTGSLNDEQLRDLYERLNYLRNLEEKKEQVLASIEEQGKLDEILKEMDENSKKRHVTGIGLTSIHELMKVRYGPDYGLYIESRVGYGTKVFAVFPYRRGSGTC